MQATLHCNYSHQRDRMTSLLAKATDALPFFLDLTSLQHLMLGSFRLETLFHWPFHNITASWCSFYTSECSLYHYWSNLTFSLFPRILFLAFLFSNSTVPGEGGGGIVTPWIISHAHKSIRLNPNSSASSPSPSPTSDYPHYGPALYWFIGLSSLSWHT